MRDTQKAENLLEVLQEMRVWSLQQSPICCNAVISACDKSGQWQVAVALLHGILHALFRL